MYPANITRAEAQARAELLSTSSYQVTVDLTGSATTFTSTSTIVFSSGAGSTFVDLIADSKPGPESMIIEAEAEQWLHGLLDVLDTRARSAVEQRFGLTDGRRRSYREVGEELGVTAEAARRLVKRAVNSVRESALSTAGRY